MTAATNGIGNLFLPSYAWFAAFRLEYVVFLVYFWTIFQQKITYNVKRKAEYHGALARISR